jgi:S-adenosylmethionine hydrolase
MMPIITFISDFGDRDWFVAAVKGQILKANPKAIIIDITHSIARHDVRSAAFVLRSTYLDFPQSTVHLVVVDPGVGSTRKPIIVQSGHYLFVGPDNGVFSYVLTETSRVFAIDITREVSTTFHARDIFAPTAGALSRGDEPQTLGTAISDYVWFSFPGIVTKRHEVHGEVLYIDHFGNLITNIPVSTPITSLRIAEKYVTLKSCYAEGKRNELIVVKGSSGFYEIAATMASAQSILHASTGMRIVAAIA